MEDLKYLNGKGPRPKHQFSAVPFVVSNRKGKLLFHTEDDGAEYLCSLLSPIFLYFFNFIYFMLFIF
jgi:hypothetical protein